MSTTESPRRTSNRTLRANLHNAATHRWEQIVEQGQDPDRLPKVVRSGVTTVVLGVDAASDTCTVIAREWEGKTLVVVSG